MKYRQRTFYTGKQKSEMWDRWQRGESLSSIGRRFNRASSSIYPLLARTGGIRPPERVRSRLAIPKTVSIGYYFARRVAFNSQFTKWNIQKPQTP